MGHILAIANQKGGVGKSTTAVNLGACLAEAGKQVLVIDLDPQGNATSGLGLDKSALVHTVYEVLVLDAPVDEAILPTEQPNLFVLPSAIRLAGAEVELVSAVSRENRLKNALAPILTRFDYILIDCPPSLGLLTINALTVARAVMIPMQCEFYALEGLSQLTNTIQLVRKHLNAELDIFGVVLTMVDARLTSTQQIAQSIQQYFSKKLFDTVIPRTVRLSEAPSHGQPITIYDKRSKGALAYRELAQEVLARV
ncbi:MAG: ParA family protein [Candidatus Sericytochromatia bacterium]|nr:ParA family protein [Candidatus Sericytochromatia bacterium]